MSDIFDSVTEDGPTAHANPRFIQTLMLNWDRQLETHQISHRQHEREIEQIESTYGVPAEDVPGTIVWRRAHDLNVRAVQQALDSALTGFGIKSSTDALARSIERIADQVRRGQFVRTR